jgi:hypothetical protein
MITGLWAILSVLLLDALENLLNCDSRMPL